MITPSIGEILKMRGNPLATGIFAAGFFIYLATGMMGAMASSFPIET
ncbi:MAG: hypothetical protein QW544_04190 [Candidatus Caldarchaeum sp.]